MQDAWCHVTTDRDCRPLERVPSVFEMRYTIVDPHGAVSFVGPCHALKMLVAACAHMPADLPTLLTYVRGLDARFADFVGNGLAVFDEHHVASSRAAPLSEEALAANPVFRVLDAPSQQRSLQPVRAGVVVFNLIERRIIQVHNTYADVRREDRGRIRREGRPVQTFYTDSLPEAWTIVP